MTVNPYDYEIIHVGYPKADKSIKISSNLAYELRAYLIEFLKNNIDLFTWKSEDMPNIDLEIISHELYVDHAKKPIQQ